MPVTWEHGLRWARELILPPAVLILLALAWVALNKALGASICLPFASLLVIALLVLRAIQKATAVPLTLADFDHYAKRIFWVDDKRNMELRGLASGLKNQQRGDPSCALTPTCLLPTRSGSRSLQPRLPLKRSGPRPTMPRGLLTPSRSLSVLSRRPSARYGLPSAASRVPCRPMRLPRSNSRVLSATLKLPSTLSPTLSRPSRKPSTTPRLKSSASTRPSRSSQRLSLPSRLLSSSTRALSTSPRLVSMRVRALSMPFVRRAGLPSRRGPRAGRGGTP